MQSEESSRRKNRFESIRATLKGNEIFHKNTIAVENKLEKRRKRKESLEVNGELVGSMLDFGEEEEVKGMDKFKEKYQMGDKIGEGSNGIVRKCFKKDDPLGPTYAVKSMEMDEEHILFLKNNFKTIRALDHPNIVKYQAMYLDLRKHVCYLVMDYETMPNLLSFKSLPEEEIKVIIHQLIGTVAYIHSHNICHRDIKPENILYDRDNKNIKLIDFGISKKTFDRGAKREMLTITGTPYYRAPEMFHGGGYD